MRVLLTGSTGFIGKSLLSYFNGIHYDCHYEVFCFSRHNTIKDIEHLQFDYIIHCAAEIYKDELMFDSNVQLTYNLLEFAKTQKHLKSFINLGSSSEYGYKSNRMAENDVLEPRNIYEATKGAATLLCQGYAKKYNIPAITIRLFSIYGPHEPPRRLIPTIYNKTITSEILSVSEGVHDFVYVDDLIDLVVLLLNERQDKIAGDIVNIGTGIQTGNLEVVQIFEQILNTKINITKVEKLRNFDSNSWACNPNYTHNKYNWQTKINLQEGIEKYITWKKLN